MTGEARIRYTNQYANGETIEERHAALEAMRQENVLLWITFFQTIELAVFRIFPLVWLCFSNYKIIRQIRMRATKGLHQHQSEATEARLTHEEDRLTRALIAIIALAAISIVPSVVSSSLTIRSSYLWNRAFWSASSSEILNRRNKKSKK